MNADLSGLEEREEQGECDGCGQSSPLSELLPVGDGSIKVCDACYGAATATVFTRVSGMRRLARER
jgi:hypothetical protein